MKTDKYSKFIKSLSLVLFFLYFSAASAQRAELKNVLLISIDDLNDWVGVLGGHPQAKTPNIDALAGRGMLFANAHTTGTSCNPARTAILTGLRPATTGVYSNAVDWRKLERLKGVATLPRYFKVQGYRTFGAGKIFHAHTYLSDGYSGYNDPDAWHAFYPSVGRQLPDEVGPHDRPANGNPGSVHFLGFDWSTVVTDDSAMGDGQVVSWVERQLAATSGAPQFLAVGIYRPHLPWYIPQEYFDMHPLEGITVPQVLESDLEDIPEIARIGEDSAILRGPEAHDWILEQNLWAEAVQGYLASTSFADAMVGRVLDALAHSGQLEETIVVLWSDHGFHLGEKHRWRKWTLWEETTHVPFIIVAPGITTPGSRTEEPVSLLDLYPTLTELAGLSVPDHLEGVSLVPLLRGQTSSWDHAAVTNNGYREHSVRDKRYRYTLHADGSEELYDLQSDQNEWHNLAGNESLADVRERLSAWLPVTHTNSEPPWTGEATD